MGEYKFYVLGCRGSRPVSGIHCQQFGGATSCYIIKADRHAIVLDCGTGLYDVHRRERTRILRMMSAAQV